MIVLAKTMDSTVRYLGVDLEDALSISESVEFYRMPANLTVGSISLICSKCLLLRIWVDQFKIAQCLLSAVGSTDRRNTLGKLLSWRLILQGLPWSFV